jgi:hypothetical protein
VVVGDIPNLVATECYELLGHQKISLLVAWWDEKLVGQLWMYFRLYVT